MNTAGRQHEAHAGVSVEVIKTTNGVISRYTAKIFCHITNVQINAPCIIINQKL